MKWLWLVVCVLVVVAGGGLVVINKKAGPTKVYRVGVLSALDFFSPITDSFKASMTKLGYVEGKNIVYDVQKGAAPVGNQKIAQKFVEDKVDLILVFPTEASLEVKEATRGTNIPVVSTAAYVEGNGLIESIQRPGNNISGVRFPIAETAAKRLEILLQIAPRAKRVFVPYLKDYPTAKPSLVALDSIAKSAGVTIIAVPFVTPDEMGAYFAKKTGNDIGIDAILLIPEPTSIVPPFADQVHKFAEVHGIPVAGVLISETGYSDIFSLIPTGLEFGRLAAPLADKLLKGVALPGMLPIVTPENDFEVNFKSIQKLGLTIDDGLLSTAKRIIR